MTNYNPDKSVLGAIANDLKYHDWVEMEAPPGFPFKIEDNPGEETIRLTRDYQGEVIKVIVHMPDLINVKEVEYDEKGRKPLVVCVYRRDGGIPLVVYVWKKDRGPSLEFSLMANPDEISIDNLSLIKEPNAASSEDHQQIAAYEGPDFRDLDENVQKAFHKSLEMRGIEPNTTNFLRKYMINKKSSEYLTWLNNLKEFIAI